MMLFASELLTKDDMRTAVQLTMVWNVEAAFADYCPTCKGLVLWSYKPEKTMHVDPLCDTYKMLIGGLDPLETIMANGDGAQVIPRDNN